MPQRIQLRRGTAPEWNLANPVLEEGELGIEMGVASVKVKVGDGASPWDQLGYFTTDASSSLTASDVTFVPTGTVGSSNVQAALAEVAAESIPLTQRGAANGVATLGSDSKIPGAQLPALAIGETFPVASQAAMLALTAQRGDVAVRTDLTPDGFFLLTSDSPATLADWVQITAAGGVFSVDGLTGAVDLSGTYVHAAGGGQETVVTVANANSAATLNLAGGNVFVVNNPTAGGTCTLTLAGATSGRSCGGTIYFHQRASGDSGLAFAGGTILHMNDGDLPGPAQVANGVAVYGWSTLDGGTTIYIWKVGDSEASTPPAVPDAPTSVVATRGNAQASVAFTPGAANGAAITLYTVTSSPGSFTATGSSSPIVVTGLTNGTAYTFTVHATNSVGNSSESSASAAVTPATVPGAPTAVVGTPGDTTASIAFSAPSSNGGNAITGYTATLSPGGATFSNASSPIVATGLTNSTAYTATVHATNAIGSGAESSASSAFTPAVGPTVPAAPTIGTATAGNAQATVTHTPNSNGGSAITGATITPYIAGVGQTPQTFMDTATTHNVVGLTNGTAYTFKVALINAVGTGSQSAATSAVTPAVPFDPSSIAGLETWFEADALSLANGDPVGSWTDSSSHARHATSTGSDRPSFVTGVINGKPVVRFSGANYLRQASFTALTQPLTRFNLVKVNAGTHPIDDGNDAGGANREAVWVEGGIYKMYGGAGIVGGGAADTSWHIVNTVWNGASSVFRKDGGAGLTGNPGTNGQDGLTLGAFNDLGTRMTGDMAAVLVYSSALSTADINAVGNYLATKYGLTWTTVP